MLFHTNIKDKTPVTENKLLAQFVLTCKKCFYIDNIRVEAGIINFPLQDELVVPINAISISVDSESDSEHDAAEGNYIFEKDS